MTDHEIAILNFRWIPPIVGGLAAVGGAALFGTLAVNLWLQVAIAGGSNIRDAYVQLGTNPLSPSQAVGGLIDVLAGVFGGFIAGRLDPSRPIVQSIKAGAIYGCFALVALIAPGQHPSPNWVAGVHIGIAFFSCALGGRLSKGRN
jgi:hypothetical protein